MTKKAIAITGGAQGIGAATARAFATRGHAVAIGDIDGELALKTAAEIAGDTGSTVVGLDVDVTDSKAFARFLDKAEKALGGLDALVNNAGIMPTGRFLDESEGVSDRQIDINVRAVVIGSKLAGNRFKDRGQGQIVNVASIVGLAAAPGIAVYAATKFAVVGLGQVLHQELEEYGVTVTTICPAYVNTQLIAGVEQPWIVRRIGLVEPEVVAKAIVDCVEKERGGQHIVPRRAASILQPVRMLPQGIAIRVGRALGLDHVAIDTDESKRGAYRDRTESLDVASVKKRGNR